MSDKLFGSWMDKRDSDWVVFAYFDWIYSSGVFVQMLECLSRGWGFGTDDVDCRFPDNSSFDVDDHFSGVEFSYGLKYDPDVVIVSDEEFSRYLGMACLKYIERTPGSAEYVRSMLCRNELGNG
ncbi:ribonuclease toxin immunity protein CdiI [Stenotrophomonas maltophilia]|uniref:ribonuclease toxin immunity protein CdiI n=1 Tax=Stenotrophomonas maltophilia TaxID=40324 RepID=UPI001FA8032B|nr:ribonuclease toxin immunity protein CdiI [Stenotrophomonas maltophilia]